jgi:hypothetical protein
MDCFIWKKSWRRGVCLYSRNFKLNPAGEIQTKLNLENIFFISEKVLSFIYGESFLAYSKSSVPEHHICSG